MCAPLIAYQLILNDKKGEHAFSSRNIIRMEASDNYTLVYLKDSRRPFVVSKVLKVYEELLGPYGFVRTHRSHLVNKHLIKHIESNIIIMQDSSVALITLRKRKACMKQLQNA